MSQKERHFARKEKVKGQFLTPSEVADFIVQFAALNTKRGIGIDPSCGNGVFLQALATNGFKDIIGIDTDEEILHKLPQHVFQRSKVFIQDGLKAFLGDIDNIADAVVGNPPFSAKYGRINDQATLSKFELGRGRKTQAIEVLFLERFLQLVSPKGIVGIILPQGIFSALPLRYVRTFIAEKAAVLGIVSLPRGIFSNATTSKTCILFAQRGRGVVKTFMGIAKHLAELPTLLEAYKSQQTLEHPPAFWVNLDPDSFDPEFYWSRKVSKWSFKELEVVPLGNLLSEMRCGATEYGEKRRFLKEGIPFISAKTVTTLGVDLSRDEKYIEPNSAMDKKRAYVRPGDIVFTRVGVGCSGRAAVIMPDLEKAIADDWIYIMRTKGISSVYLALFLQTKLGQQQINMLKRGVGTVTIPQALLKKILVPLPSDSLQESLEAGYKEMVQLRETNHLSEAEEKFKSLLSSIEMALMSSK